MKPKNVRIVDGVPCMTVMEHEHIVGELFRKEWVGLTDSEYISIIISHTDPIECCKDIEARLKEKNA
jgi:hypothetical protein